VKVVVTGGTGFIGRPLVRAVLAAGADVWVLSRSPDPVLPDGARAVAWSAAPEGGEAPAPPWAAAAEGAGAVVHLAGESIAARRWTDAQKNRIRESRILSTRAVVDGLAALPAPRPVLLSASAVGYYGPCGDQELTEEAPPGRDFLSGVCVAAETEARRAEALGVRVVCLRTGLVLAADGGALPRLLPPFRLGVGGPLGSGRQWVPWIHRDDVVGLIVHLMGANGVAGPVNVVAPTPVRNRDLARALGRLLRRPAAFPAPAPLLRLMLGEMADALLLSGQRAVPARALAAGYRFRHPDLEPALRDALGGG
jgi:uncharacterized protein (TIGR01777 family)